MLGARSAVRLGHTAKWGPSGPSRSTTKQKYCQNKPVPSRTRPRATGVQAGQMSCSLARHRRKRPLTKPPPPFTRVTKQQCTKFSQRHQPPTTTFTHPASWVPDRPCVLVTRSVGKGPSAITKGAGHLTVPLSRPRATGVQTGHVSGSLVGSVYSPKNGIGRNQLSETYNKLLTKNKRDTLVNTNPPTTPTHLLI